MREIRRSALVPYSAPQMYELVADVERYPEFLPWCTAARVLERCDSTVVASLSLAKGRARASFTTRNTLVRGRCLEMQLVEGPFSSLEGRWDFTDIGLAGSRVELAVRFAAAATLAGILLGPAFEGICSQLVDAFGRRARQVYGTR
jgi:ribosome-associated toxin RatA of RatAB toxin-antitoxin module